MNKVGVGVIGTGPWGKNHVRIYGQLKQANFLAVSDLYPPDWLNTLNGVKIFKDYKEMLAMPDIKAVSICTPASTHYKIATDCLNAGKNVLTEKPLTLSSEEARKLVKLARDKELCLMVGHTFRFDETTKWIKSKIAEGFFGKVYYLSLQRMGLKRPREDCGAIFNYSPHDFDTFSFVMGEKFPKEITSIVQNGLERKFEDFALVCAKYSKDALAYSQVTWLAPKTLREFWVVGEKKSAFVDTKEGRITLYDSRIDPKQLLPIAGQESVVEIAYKEPLKEELAHFLDCCNNPKLSVESSGEVGLNAVLMMEAALKSAELKRTVELRTDGTHV